MSNIKITYTSKKEVDFCVKSCILLPLLLNERKNMFISEAFAQTVQATADAQNVTGSGMAAFAQLILIFGILYLLFIRPQRKKLQQHEAALNAITKGTKVIIGGIVGTVVRIEDNGKLTVKIADNTEITVIRGYISQVLEEDK